MLLLSPPALRREGLSDGGVRLRRVAGVVPEPARQVPEAGEAAGQVPVARHPFLQQHDAQHVPRHLASLPRLPRPAQHGRQQHAPLPADERLLPRGHGGHGGQWSALLCVCDLSVVVYTCNQSVVVYTCNQSVVVYTYNQSVVVYACNQSVAVYTCNQSVVVYTCNRSVVVYTCNQSVAVYTSNRSVVVYTCIQS